MKTNSLPLPPFEGTMKRHDIHFLFFWLLAIDTSDSRNQFLYKLKFLGDPWMTVFFLKELELAKMGDLDRKDKKEA